MKNLSKNKLWLTTLSIILVIILACSIGFSFIDTAFAQDIEENVANMTENNYAITNTQTPNNIRLDSYGNNNYGQNAELSLGTDKRMKVLGDDDIVKIVPEELFKKEGITQHMGKEYGFFIETRKPFEYNDMLLSTVVIIDVIQINDMFSEASMSHLKIEIKPIFQADFAYIERGNDRIYSLQEQEKDFFVDNYQLDLNIEFPASGSGFVVPIPTLDKGSFVEMPSLNFQQHNKYYLTDVSNLTSLYNVNDLNPFDDNYVAQNDMGCFFSQTDFSYDGIFINEGTFSFSDAGKVGFNAMSCAFDWYDMAKGFKSVLKYAPVVGSIISTLDVIKEFGQITSNLKDEQVREEKTFTYKPFYNNKDQQIANGGLRKDSMIAIQSISEERLLFGTNDNFVFDYQINCQDITVDTRYATMLNIGVVSIQNGDYDKAKLGEVHRSTSVFSNNLKNHTEDNYKEIPNIEMNGLEAVNMINILPNFNSTKQFIPKFSGIYKFDLSYNRFAKFRLYEATFKEDGKINILDLSQIVGESTNINGYAKSGEMYLYKDKTYLLITDLNDKVDVDGVHGRYATVDLNVEFLPKEVKLGDNEINLKDAEEYLKFNSAKNVNYRFTCVSDAYTLALLDSNFDIIETTENGEFVIVLEKNKDHYFKISGNVGDNGSLKIRDEMYVQFENLDNITNVIDRHLTVSSFDSVVLPHPEKTGYTFDGWWTSLEVYGELVDEYSIRGLTRPNLTLYAKWSAIKYNIHFEVNGGTEIPDMKYTIEDAVLLNQDTTKANYYFCGWFENADLTGSAVEILAEGNMGDITFYAKWVNARFSVNLDVNKAVTDDVAAEISTTHFEVNYNSNYSLPIPTLDGFIFEGWYNGTVKYTDNNGLSIHKYTDEQNADLTAKWSREKYFIKINSNGSYKWLTKNGDDFIFSDVETSIDNQIGLCPNCFIMQEIAKGGSAEANIMRHLFREGHVYLNMIKDKDDPTSIACWNGLDFAKNYNDSVTVEVFASHRIEKQFKLYIEDSDSVSPQILYGDYGSEINFEQVPLQTGYTFAYFKVSDNPLNADMYNGTHLAPGKDFRYTTMPDLSVGIELDGNAIYLTPIFTANRYLVNLVDNNSVIGVKYVYFDQPYNVSSGNAFMVPVNLGYDFLGWYTGINGNGRQITDEEGNCNEWDIPNNIDLYPRWELTKFLITYDTKGGSLPEDFGAEPKEGVTWYTIKTDITDHSWVVPKKYGFKFDCWMVDTNPVVENFTEVYKRDIVLTTKWKGIEQSFSQEGEYTITNEIVKVNVIWLLISKPMKFYIADSVNEVSFMGTTLLNMQDKSIIVEKRSTPLIIRLKNMNFRGHSNTPAIDARNCKDLTIEAVGIENHIQSGISRSTNLAALVCNNLNLIGDELNIMGAPSWLVDDDGNAFDASHGIYGGGSPASSYIMNISIKKLTIKGGSSRNGNYGKSGAEQTFVPGKAEKGDKGTVGNVGGAGGDGGNGGAGGCGIKYSGYININSQSEVIAQGGSGGDGGDGGSGGRGGKGGEGGNAVWFGPSGKDGGRGGAGGTGGNGGRGGKAGNGIAANRISGKYTSIAGTAGKGGIGGIGGGGGDGGLGGFYLNEKDRHDTGASGPSGADGGNGANG